MNALLGSGGRMRFSPSFGGVDRPDIYGRGGTGEQALEDDALCGIPCRLLVSSDELFVARLLYL